MSEETRFYCPKCGDNFLYAAGMTYGEILSLEHNQKHLNVRMDVLRMENNSLKNERDKLRAENEKLRAAMTAFMDAYYKQMRLQGWSDLDVFYNDDYRAAAKALKETGNE